MAAASLYLAAIRAKLERYVCGAAFVGVDPGHSFRSLSGRTWQEQLIDDLVVTWCWKTYFIFSFLFQICLFLFHPSFTKSQWKTVCKMKPGMPGERARADESFSDQGIKENSGSYLKIKLLSGKAIKSRGWPWVQLGLRGVLGDVDKLEKVSFLAEIQQTLTRPLESAWELRALAPILQRLYCQMSYYHFTALYLRHPIYVIL